MRNGRIQKTMFETAEAVFTWIGQNPLWLLLFAFLAYRFYSARKPFPVVEGSRVKSISSLKEFSAVFEVLKEQAEKEGEESKTIVVTDFYATWCPPCRAAAPVFGQWSKDYDESKVIFCKVNVDNAREVASHYSISAMPTFKVFDANQNEMETFVGWRKNQLQAFIEGNVKEQAAQSDKKKS